MTEKGIITHSTSKIQYLIWETNTKRIHLIWISEYLSQKKNMSYEQWTTLHYIKDKLKEYIRKNDEEIYRISNGDVDE